MPPSPTTPDEPAVPSPCIDVCRLDAAEPVCVGCFRTLDDIAGWSGFSNAQRRAAVARATARRIVRRLEAGSP